MQLKSGNRTLTRAWMEARIYKIEEQRGVSRKELSLAGREAVQALELAPSLRLVLTELIGVYGEVELKGRLMVWPSNEYLILRTGLSERTVRYCLKALVDLKLVSPRDSANGKRFGIRNAQGQIVDAYGFDLTPLYARRGEFLETLTVQKLHRASLGRLFDQITICRRAAEEALLACSGRFPELILIDILAGLAALKSKTPRRGSKTVPDGLLESWIALQVEAEELFYRSGNDGKDCRHIETDNESPGITCARAFEEKVAAPTLPQPAVSLVVEACPAAKSYYSGRIETARELVQAAEFLRPALGAHKSAWNEAVELLGGVGAAAVLFVVLQRHDDDQTAGTARIQNPGGYFRAMARTVAERGVNLDLELMTMRRKRQVKSR